jgi:hypothetical protein
MEPPPSSTGDIARHPGQDGAMLSQRTRRAPFMRIATKG